MKTAVVFRFSAMGDVALTMATLATVLKYNPTLQIIFVTRKKFAPFFNGYPQIQVFPCDFENQHKGVKGLYQLFKQLNSFNPNYILDLHQNLRTNILKLFFSLSGKRIYSLNKHRSEKKSIVSGKSNDPIKHISEQYLDVFKEANIVKETVSIENLAPIFKPSPAAKNKVSEWVKYQESSNFIGIAPFAQHIGKIWPLEKYVSLIKRLSQSLPTYKILLFGGGQSEFDQLDKVAEENKNCVNVVGKFSLEEELELIGKVKYFISGDTSNMHFAALMGVEVISIWGATSTLTGFGPLFQSDKNIVEIPKEQLQCRPCSVYGKKPCKRGDYACLEWIDPDKVLQSME